MSRTRPLPPERDAERRELSKDIGCRLKQARKDIGMSVREVAEALYYSPDPIAHMERGDRHARDLGLIIGLSALYGVDPLSVFGESRDGCEEQAA